MTDYESIVSGFIHCLWMTDGARLGEHLTEDYRSHESPDAPPGPKGELEVAAVWKTAFPDFNYKIDAVIGDGDRVASVGTISGTHLGEYDSNPASGRKFSVKTVDLLTLRDGKICEHRGLYEDTLLMKQLGL
ncbi:ester cyclase (plasmid) [Rhodococcus opacus]|uniref:ester cyclase n=1 Tax=Rhodococcus opacus TaxID=37919 RepID=UPI0034D1A954